MINTDRNEKGTQRQRHRHRDTETQRDTETKRQRDKETKRQKIGCQNHEPVLWEKNIGKK